VARPVGRPDDRNAYLAGTFIALACGTVGWLIVLRAQVFAADALSHVAFVGAIAAAAIGLDERLGLFIATIAVAAGIGLLGPRGQAGDAVIGIVFAWILGIGTLLLSVLATSPDGATASPARTPCLARSTRSARANRASPRSWASRSRS
jgi:zinc/manganese transport system permease protein